jgi:uncharacterized membrane protein (UPF0182 family)
MFFVSVALAIGALDRHRQRHSTPRGRWLHRRVLPAVVCFVVAGVAGWYVTSFVVKPNELVREEQYITIQHSDDPQGLRP